MCLKVYQIRVKLYLLENILIEKIPAQVTKFIDYTLGDCNQFLKFHEENKYKLYSFDYLYPIEPEKIYKKGNIYTLTVRTIDYNLEQYLRKNLPRTRTNVIQGLESSCYVLPQKKIESIYTLTPVIVKDNENGYWRGHMKLEEFEERLKINLINKWNEYFEDTLSENFVLYSKMDFLNKGVIPIKYKDITLLGDKVRLFITEEEIAQKLAYMSLGTGLLESNSRGFGFVNYRWK